MNTINPIIEWRRIQGADCLYFTFCDEFKDDQAGPAVEVWRRALDASSAEKTNIVWNCLGMTGYEPGARSKWQKALNAMKERTGDIWVITDSKVIGMGAMLINTSTHLEIRVVKS